MLNNQFASINIEFYFNSNLIDLFSRFKEEKIEKIFTTCLQIGSKKDRREGFEILIFFACGRFSSGSF